MNYLQSPEPSKPGQGVTANTTSKKRKTDDADAVDAPPPKKARSINDNAEEVDQEAGKLETGHTETGYVEAGYVEAGYVEAAVAHEEQGEATTGEAVLTPATDYAGIGEYTAMLLTEQEIEGLGEDIGFDELDVLFDTHYAS